MGSRSDALTPFKISIRRRGNPRPISKILAPGKKTHRASRLAPLKTGTLKSFM
jgi:hypothetical protein